MDAGACDRNPGAHEKRGQPVTVLQGTGWGHRGALCLQKRPDTLQQTRLSKPATVGTVPRPNKVTEGSNVPSPEKRGGWHFQEQLSMKP